MKTYSEFLAAGVPLQLQIGGKVLYVQRSEAGQVLTVEFLNGVNVQSVERVGKGFKAAPAGGFGSIRITASESGTVDFVVTDGEIDVKFDDAATVIGNDDGQAVPVRLPAGARMPVDIAGGNVQLTASNVGINNTDDNAIPTRQKPGDSFAVRTVRQTKIVDLTPVAVGVERVAVVSDAALQGVRFKNVHATARVALGGAGVTLANAAIMLEPGDMWNETDAPGAAWFAISDTAGASVQVQGVKA